MVGHRSSTKLPRLLQISSRFELRPRSRAPR
jgi:hypothetical protein